MSVSAIAKFSVEIVDALALFRESILSAQAQSAQLVQEREHAIRADFQKQQALAQAKVEDQKQAALEREARNAKDRQTAEDISKVVNACAKGDFSHQITCGYLALAFQIRWPRFQSHDVGMM